MQNIYTAEQIERFATVTGCSLGDANYRLHALHSKGITVTFPRRYYAAYCIIGAEDGFAVRDRYNQNQALVFYFEQLDGSHVVAAEHEAERLNSKVPT